MILLYVLLGVLFLPFFILFLPFLFLFAFISLLFGGDNCCCNPCSNHTCSRKGKSM